MNIGAKDVAGRAETRSPEAGSWKLVELERPSQMVGTRQTRVAHRLAISAHSQGIPGGKTILHCPRSSDRTGFRALSDAGRAMADRTGCFGPAQGGQWRTSDFACIAQQMDTDAVYGAAPRTDPDDCFAIAWLVAGGFDFVGISTSFGNASGDFVEKTVTWLVDLMTEKRHGSDPGLPRAAQAQVSSATPTARRAQDVAMDRRYRHLNGEERGVILAEHRRGASLGTIGALPGCRASTIGRELGRGGPERDLAQPYCAQRG